MGQQVAQTRVGQNIAFAREYDRHLFSATFRPASAQVSLLRHRPRTWRDRRRRGQMLQVTHRSTVSNYVGAHISAHVGRTPTNAEQTWLRLQRSRPEPGRTRSNLGTARPPWTEMGQSFFRNRLKLQTKSCRTIRRVCSTTTPASGLRASKVSCKSCRLENIAEIGAKTFRRALQYGNRACKSRPRAMSAIQLPRQRTSAPAKEPNERGTWRAMTESLLPIPRSSGSPSEDEASRRDNIHSIIACRTSRWGDEKA